jgi:4a-hydroxytetrahydrobiopterin dehydratase
MPRRSKRCLALSQKGASHLLAVAGVRVRPAYADRMEKPITRAEAEQRVNEMGGWELAGDSITRQFTFAGFPEAIQFVVRLGFAAEAADHHPDLLINYKRVRVTYSTHSAGGLTDKDFIGAATAVAVADRLGAK